MKVELAFQDRRIALDVPEDRLVGQWSGPAGSSVEPAEALIAALDAPMDFPAIGEVVYPGDRVVVALDAGLPAAATLVEAIIDRMQRLEIATKDVEFVVSGSLLDRREPKLADGVRWTVHDPDDRAELAYLASTKAGRRVYLNRALCEADVVIPVGRLGFAAGLGVRGPWSLIDPDLSERPAIQALAAMRSKNRVEKDSAPSARFEEALEVSWLLGCQFQVAVLEGPEGIARIMAGETTRLAEVGRQTQLDAWTLEVSEPADLVVAAVGRPAADAGLAELAQALDTARLSCRRGGRIVVLSEVEGTAGPALQRLVGLDSPREAIAALKGAEGEADAPIAMALAEALVHADVYLMSRLPSELVEDLGVMPISAAAEVQRLVDQAASTLIVERAEATRVRMAGASS